MLGFEKKVNMTEAFVLRLNKRFLCQWLTRKTAVTNPRRVAAIKDKYDILQGLTSRLYFSSDSKTMRAAELVYANEAHDLGDFKHLFRESGSPGRLAINNRGLIERNLVGKTSRADPKQVHIKNS